ncbi:hypothetical protein [Shewanella algae]|uniref:hypothetical protein n=1 Tax=Shewanella algae TaxID=38313 RepID=UPI0011875984|nr:hypothetical protein [Shewanella algae]
MAAFVFEAVQAGNAGLMAKLTSRICSKIAAWLIGSLLFLYLLVFNAALCGFLELFTEKYFVFVCYLFLICAFVNAPFLSEFI